jgi:hypothetical protein
VRPSEGTEGEEDDDDGNGSRPKDSLIGNVDGDGDGDDDGDTEADEEADADDDDDADDEDDECTLDIVDNFRRQSDTRSASNRMKEKSQHKEAVKRERQIP